MADTPRTLSQLLTTLFQDSQAPASITPQDMRDLIVSVAAGLSSISITVVAAGTTQGTATLLTSSCNVITTCPAGAGVRADPALLPGNRIIAINVSANPANVFPWSGATIVGLTANEPLQLAVSASVQLLVVSSTIIGII